MSIDAENGFEWSMADFRRGYTVTGSTYTEDFSLWPGFFAIHTGLSRVAAADAAIGIVEYSTADDRRETRTFNNYADWPTTVYRRLGHYTIGVHVLAGQVKGWWYVQVWS